MLCKAENSKRPLLIHLCYCKSVIHKQFDTSFSHQLLGESFLSCFRGGMFFVPQAIISSPVGSLCNTPGIAYRPSQAIIICNNYTETPKLQAF